MFVWYIYYHTLYTRLTDLSFRIHNRRLSDPVVAVLAVNNAAALKAEKGEQVAGTAKKCVGFGVSFGGLQICIHVEAYTIAQPPDPTMTYIHPQAQGWHRRGGEQADAAAAPPPHGEPGARLRPRWEGTVQTTLYWIGLYASFDTNKKKNLLYLID